MDDLDAKMQAVASEFDKSAREGKAADELTGRVWALDQRQLLNTRAWLEGKEASREQGAAFRIVLQARSSLTNHFHTVQTGPT